MCGIVKKVVVLTAIVGGGLFALNHVWSGSVGTAWKRATARFERSIDPDFELARIRDEITKLTPDMHRNISRIAEEMVAVESLERRVTDLQTRLDTAKNELALLTNAVENGATRVSIHGREVSVGQVKDKLAHLQGPGTGTQQQPEGTRRQEGRRGRALASSSPK